MISEFLYDRMVYIYEFWTGIVEWAQRTSMPEWIPFDPMDMITGPTWQTWLFFGIVAVLYIAFCLLMVKLAKLPLGWIDRHMRNHNASLGLNLPLYLLALGLVFFDERVFGKQGRLEDGTINIDFFTLIALVLLLIAVFRMIRRAGLRFIYFIPLQASLFVIVYLYLLLWAPAAVIVLYFAVLGGAFVAKEPGVSSRVCPHCGGAFSPGVSCGCGRSTGAYY